MPPTTPWLIMVLAALAAIGAFSTDTYLPAFGIMTHELGATDVEIQQSITCYMATFAVMVLWHGALSDRFGRRSVLIFMTLGYAAASIVCALAPSIGWLWAGRALQGVFAGAGMVVGRAIIGDLYAGAQAQRLMAQMMLIFGLAPAIAPLTGEALLALFGWRSIFVFLALFGALLAFLSWKILPETLPPAARQPFVPGPLARAYHEVLTHRGFVLVSLASAMIFNGYFLYVVSAPVFVSKLLGLGSLGWLFLPTVVGMMAGSALSARMAGRWNDRKTITTGLAIIGAASLLEIILSVAPVPRASEIIAISVYNFGVAFIMPSLTLIALNLFPTRRGLAASCQSFLQVGANALTAGVLAPLLWGTPFYLALGAAGCFLFGLFMLWLGVKKC